MTARRISDSCNNWFGSLKTAATKPRFSNNWNNFKSRHFTILISSDILSRGFNHPDCGFVISYDLPVSIEEEAKESECQINFENDAYLHRIGRTARAGEEGKVINLLCDFDHDNFSRILSDYRDYSDCSFKCDCCGFDPA